jgi:TetR/AcrR family transcriptional repressor of bet genes
MNNHSFIACDIGLYYLFHMSATAPRTRRRAASPEQRREQLIKATIKCIARKGLSKITMADVTKTAKLSLGIINLHFQSKDKLLVEVLRYIAEEYKQGWDAIVSDDSKTPAEKVTALIEFDFSPEVTHPAKLSVWFAFWGESSSRPLYRQICNDADMQTSGSMLKLCRELGCSSERRAKLITTGYTALADGLWLDLLVTPEETTPQLARDTCLNYMASVFPQHFKPPV